MSLSFNLDPNLFNPGQPNAFQDPSIQQAIQPNQGSRSSVGGQASGGASGDYNPFAQQQQGTPTPLIPPPPSAAQVRASMHSAHTTANVPPPIMKGMEPPPSYAPSAATRITTEELEKRQRDLEAREAELRAREERLRTAQLSGLAQMPPNWPPLPSWFPFGPCFYQDINVEIPPQFQRAVSLGYYLYLVHVLVLLVNMIVALAYFVVEGGKTGGSAAATTFGLSIIYLLVLTPCGYVCWFRPLYKAFKTDSSLNFFIFFFIFSVWFFLMLVFCIGFDGYGAVGWINGLRTLSDSMFVGLLMLLVAASTTTLAVLDVFLLMHVHRLYRSTGASFERAREEFGGAIASSQTFREVGAAALRSQLPGAGGMTSGGGGGGRF